MHGFLSSSMVIFLSMTVELFLKVQEDIHDSFLSWFSLNSGGVDKKAPPLPSTMNIT